ncbi:hypothetical protein BO86DRAFT_216696 [Aspergillus japonicus CBS 114.51]|uniref:Uncharacterized protein n=1 Tax=Aspergillus japonicus CBS 114.51 TaxID=1448312 RepID=A0A8T8WPI8_ASPJA|nr:hypothetical protein BO86DRAFT_216696 [Aspergillus japonicus CBS 114.51]RAH77512.1 hypothetical protein BO86DRAFT_216696 [Aspergillus japonicus CBS 114.51]
MSAGGATVQMRKPQNKLNGAFWDVDRKRSGCMHARTHACRSVSGRLCFSYGLFLFLLLFWQSLFSSSIMSISLKISRPCSKLKLSCSSGPSSSYLVNSPLTRKLQPN